MCVYVLLFLQNGLGTAHFVIGIMILALQFTNVSMCATIGRNTSGTVYHGTFVDFAVCRIYHRKSFMPNNLHHRHNP